MLQVFGAKPALYCVSQTKTKRQQQLHDFPFSAGEEVRTLVERSLPQGTVRNTCTPYMDTLSSEQLLLLQIYQHVFIFQFHVFLAYLLKFWFLQE